MRRSGSARRGLPATPGIAAPADRRFRRAEAAPQRRRLGRLLLRYARRLIPALVMLAVAAACGFWLLTTPWLRVQRIVVGGTGRLSPNDVIALVSDLRGQNILRVSLDRARLAILASPWVGEVAVTRVLPSTLAIHVSERIPMAVGRLGSQLKLVDRTGVVIDDYTAAYHDLDLPIVDGLIDPGGTAQAAAGPVGLTAALMDALAAQPALRRAVSQVDVSNPHDAVVLLEGDVTWLHLGEVDFLERLKKYLDLRPTFEDQFRNVEYVDLRYGRWLYARPDTGGKVQGLTP